MLLYPIVEVLARHMARGLAVLVVMIGLAVVLGGASAGVAATIADNVNLLQDQAPAAAAELEADSEVARDLGLVERVEAFVDDIDRRLGTRAQVERTTSAVSTYVVTGILVVFFIVYGPRLVTGMVGQIRDDDRRRRIEIVGTAALDSWRRYALIAFAEVIVVTLISWFVLWAIDLPAPFVLGLLVGGFSVIPLAGVVFGGLPALFFAAATGDVGRVVAVVALVLVLQLLEVGLRRRVDHSTVYVGPALPLIVALLGWEFYGLGGVVYGVLLLILALALADAISADEQPVVDRPPG